MPEIEWRIATSPVHYPEAIQEMELRVEAIESGQAPELLWLLEHPPLYTAGTSASDDELIDAHGFPIYETGRGGRYTYHGPGQRIIYALTDLRTRNRDIRAHICRLEQWVIDVLKEFGIKGERRTGRVGIWVDHDGREEKIAAIGVRVRRWISYHGLSLNVAPNLEHFKGIIPCGLPDYGVTSMQDIGVKASQTEVDEAFKKTFSKAFN